MDVQYLSQEQLSGFENYKYSAVDTSPLSIYVMHPFWNYVVEWCPKWIAPNVLTFVGFLFTVLNFLMFSYYDYYFYASSDEHPEVPAVPEWVWAAAAFNIFLAYTLDGIDGKQARRTQTSGPLGELFDHGLDSWTAFLIPTCMYSVFGRGVHSIPPLRMYFCLWNVFINFYLSHWEKHNTGVLFLPWGYDASMVVAILIFVVTSIFGHKVWSFTLPGGISAGHMFELTFYICAILSNLPMCLWNVYKSYRDGTGKMRPFSDAVRPLVPLSLFLVLFTLWVVYSHADVINLDPRCVYLVTGTIFSNICIVTDVLEGWPPTSSGSKYTTVAYALKMQVASYWDPEAGGSKCCQNVGNCSFIHQNACIFIIATCRLIVSMMSSARCELLNWLILPTGVVVAVSLMLPSTTGASAELGMLYALALITTVAHVHYGTCVVRQMCKHFRISCFRVHQHRE